MRKAALILSVLLVGCATQSKNDVSSSPTALEQFLQNGYSELSRRNYMNAIEEFENAVYLCEGQYSDSETRYYAARTLTETMFYMVRAAADETKAVAVGTQCSDALYLRGYAGIDLGELDSAQIFIERAVRMSPMNSMYLSELGHILQAKRDWQKALETYELSAEAAQTYSPEELKNKELARAKRGIGYVLIELGRLDEAEIQFRECLDIDAEDAGAIGELKYIEDLRNQSMQPPNKSSKRDVNFTR